METKEATTTSNQNVTGEPISETSSEVTGKLRIDIPTDEKKPDPIQEAKSENVKSSTNDAKDDSAKDSKDNSEDKDDFKGDSKDDATKESKDDSKKDSKDESNDNSKEASKEDFKDDSKDDSKNDSNDDSTKDTKNDCTKDTKDKSTKNSEDDSTNDDSEDEDTKDYNAQRKWQEERKKVPRKAAVKWSDYEHFKNRYSEEEGLEIIEVLYGHTGLSNEITQEKARRNIKRAIAGKKPQEAANLWIQRVRIESHVLIPLLAHLSSCDEVINSWDSDKPRVFFRPFTTLYHTLPLVKEILQRLENAGDGFTSDMADIELKSPVLATDTTNWESVLDGTKNSPSHTNVIFNTAGTNLWEVLTDLDPSTTVALEHLRVYIDFVEKNIIPMWDEAAGTSKQRARFCDLPMFFRPGELLLSTYGTTAPTPTAATSSVASVLNKPSGHRARQMIWKLCFASLSDMNNGEPSDWRTCGRSLLIRAYHFDFDGELYGPSFMDSTIKEYSGEKDIRSLTTYPLRYEKERNKVEAELYERGKRFPSLVRERHCYHDGWSLLYNKYGNYDEEPSSNAEYVDGEIMIDFKEGSRANPGLVDQVELPSEPDACRWDDSSDPVEIMFWKDSTRLKLLGKFRDITQTEESFDKHHVRAMLKRDAFIKAFNEDEHWLRQYTEDLSSRFDKEQCILFPQRLVAYSFRSRKFFNADIDSISTISTPRHSFRDLRIDPNHKKMVKSLVRSHFEKQKVRREASATNLDQDFIRGKGAGLIMLLHGVPGVGKTTTAEAVALHTRKPLFTITSGDLGFTPADVEKALQETFRLAQIWDCVLLLDEADLFLSRREVEDMERNALVSVFLRVLEYYNGILFLTTNRVGTIDEAFKSRIHVSLYYPPLDYKQTHDIFMVNLRRLHEIEEAKQEYQSDYSALELDDDSILKFATRHFNTHKPAQRWNGRQIRNAFQVAYSLAQFDMDASHPDDSDDEDAPSPRAHLNGKAVPPGQHRVILTGDQFDTVNETIQRFDSYLFKTRGADADTAKRHQIRNDNYYDPREFERQTPGLGYSQTPQRPQYRPAPPRSPSGRPSMFGPAAPYPGYSQHEGWDDDSSPNHDGGEFESLAGMGADFGNPKNGFASFSPRHQQQQQQPPYSPHPSPAARRGGRRGPEGQYDYHQGMTGGGDEHSPDDTGFNRGGSISGGRATAYAYGGP